MIKSGPIRIQGPHIDSSIAKAQRETADHVWKYISKSKSFYIADSVGAGKSYIALALALGKWRILKRKNQKIFRLIIIAPTSELCNSWLNKLGGSFRESKERIGEFGIIPQEGSFFDYYLDEYHKDPPEIAVYHFRGKNDVNNLMSELKDSPLKVLKPKSSSSMNRIEILVTTPNWLVRGRLGGTGTKKCKEALFWLDWLRSVDCIIADEVFTAKNANTNYGRLLRPNNNLPKFNIWNTRWGRPWLIGLSATLLSRDISDAWSLFELAWGWRHNDFKFNDSNYKAFGTLKDELNEFQVSLKEGLSSDSKNLAKHSKAYIEKKKKLENNLKKIIVRTQPTQKRTYEFWSAASTKMNRSKASGTFPLKDGLDGVFKALSNTPTDDSLAIENLAHFIKTAWKKKKTFDNNQVTIPDTWTQITETRDGYHGPKHISFKVWLENHYDSAEKDWLDPNKNEEFKFKALVYVKHVRTADVFKHRHSKDELKTIFGKDLHKLIRAKMLKTCHALALKNRELFDGGKLDHPCNELKYLFEVLSVKGNPIETLKKPEYLTLLLASLVHANKGKNKKEKLARMQRTLNGQISDSGKNIYLRLLGRYIDIRKEILNQLELQNLIEFDHHEENIKKKYPSLSLHALDIDHSTLDESEKQEFLAIANSLAHEIFSTLGISANRTKYKLAKEKITEFTKLITERVIDSSSWLGKNKSLSRKSFEGKQHYCKQLKKRAEFVNRKFHAPSEIEVLTGADLHRRNHITQKFLTPGSPYLLVLTNICTVGVDLHQFCWDVVHFTPSWTPHELEQKTGRIDRPRTKLKDVFDIATKKDQVRVHHLVWPHTYDERMLSRVHLRSQYSERLLGSKSQNTLENKSISNIEDKFSSFPPLDLKPDKS